MSRTQTKGPVGGDVVKHFYSSEYSLEDAHYTNEGADPVDIPPGYPVVVNSATGAITLVAAADIANATGITLQGHRAYAGEKTPIAVLARGPGIVNRDALPTNDLAADAAINMTSFVARLLVLGLVSRSEPTVQSLQET